MTPDASTPVIVRRYEPADREAIRRICCETADRGEPVEHFFRDREIFADLLLRYYLEQEPQATWLAEFEGRVIGYLTGCLDSRRYQRVMTWRIVPSAVCKAIGRGVLRHPQTWALLQGGAAVWLQGGFAHHVPLQAYPAHLHVNVLEKFRGRTAGRQLIERFCEQVRAAGLGGVHAVARGDNPPACAFFERMGFSQVSRHPTTLFTGSLHYTVIYGKRLTQ